MCADVPLRPWHSAEILCEIVKCFTQRSCRSAPALAVGHGSISSFGLSSCHPRILVSRDVGIRMVHEVSDKNVSHSHLGTVLRSRRDTSLNKPSHGNVVHQPRRCQRAPQL